MGYYTKFKITSLTEGITDKEAESLVLDVVNEKYGDPFEDECKWYNHVEHMKEVSEKNPSIVFKLQGEGEDPGDMWNKYFKNGKMQVCKVQFIFPPYDESKLV